MDNLILFLVWCASVAGDFKTYIVAAENEENAVKTIPLFMRQDFEVYFASFDQACDFGCKRIADDTVVFEDKIFKYNPTTTHLECVGEEKTIAEKMKEMLISMNKDEEIIEIIETTFALRGIKGGDPSSPIVAVVMSDHTDELRLYNDPNEQYFKINPDDKIKSLELFSGYDFDEELEYMGSWSVINGEIKK